MTTQCHKRWQRRLPCGRQRGQLPRRQGGSQVIGIRFGRAVSPQTQRASVERAECRGHGCADRPADQPDLGCVPAFPPAPKDRLIAIFFGIHRSPGSCRGGCDRIGGRGRGLKACPVIAGGKRSAATGCRLYNPCRVEWNGCWG